MTDQEIAELQRKYLRDVADRIELGEELGEPLGELDSWFIAACLRAFADRIPDEPKRRRGRAQAVEWIAVAMDARQGKTQEQLAEQYDISVTMVKKIIKKVDAALFERLENAGITRKTK